MEVFLDILLISLLACGIWKAIVLTRQQYLKRHGKTISKESKKGKSINYPLPASSPVEHTISDMEGKEYEDAWNREEIEWYYLQHEKEQEEIDEEEVMMYHHMLYDEDEDR